MLKRLISVMIAFLFMFSQISLISVVAGGGAGVVQSQSGGEVGAIFSPFDFSKASVIDLSSDQTSGTNWFMNPNMQDEITICANGSYVIKNQSVGVKHVVVADGVTANIKFSNVKLDCSNENLNASPLYLGQNTDTNLVLEGKNYLKSGANYHNAAICLQDASKISIYGTNFNDSLTVIADGRGAGIGGNGGINSNGKDSGEINIYSGIVTAISEFGSGLGGGAGCKTLDNNVIAFSGGDCGTIKIFGGLISAQSNGFSAGIGGGAGNYNDTEENSGAGDGGNIIVSGGTIYAKSKNAMDIGNGCGGGDADYGTLTITGGSLKADNIAPPTDGNNPVALAIINYAPNLKNVLVKIDGKFVNWNIFQNYVNDESLYIWLPICVSNDGNYIEYEMKVTIKLPNNTEKDYLYNIKYDGNKFNVILASTSDPINLSPFDQWWKDEIRVTADAGVFPEGSELKVIAAEDDQESADFVEKHLDHPQIIGGLKAYRIGVYQNGEKLMIPKDKTAKIWIKIPDDIKESTNLDLDKLHGMFVSEEQDEILDHDELAKFTHDGKEQDYYVITVDHFSHYVLAHTKTLPDKIIYEKGSIVTIKQFTEDLDSEFEHNVTPVEISEEDFSSIDFDTIGEYKVSVSIINHVTKEKLTVQDVNVKITDWGEFDRWWGDEIRVKAPIGQFPNDAKLVVQHAKDDKNDLKLIEQNIDNPNEIEHFNAYKISVLDAQEQPIEKFDTTEVWIKIPDNWDLDELYSSFVAEGKDEIFKDGKIQKFKHNDKTFQYYVFNTNHFSHYALVDMLTSKDRAVNANSGQEIFSSVIIYSMMMASFVAIVLFINKKNNRSI